MLVAFNRFRATFETTGSQPKTALLPLNGAHAHKPYVAQKSHSSLEAPCYSESTHDSIHSYCIPKQRSPKTLRFRLASTSLARDALHIDAPNIGYIEFAFNRATNLVLFGRHVFHAQRYEHLAHRK